MYFSIVFLAAMQLLITSITTEKEHKILEGMKMMGLMDSVYWVSWFITQTVLNLIVIVVFFVTMIILDMMQNMDPSLLAVMMIAYSCTIITFGFLVTAISSSPKTAGTIADQSITTLVVTPRGRTHSYPCGSCVFD